MMLNCTSGALHNKIRSLIVIKNTLLNCRTAGPIIVSSSILYNCSYVTKIGTKASF